MAFAADAEIRSVHHTACVGCHARITGGDGTLLYGRPDGLVHDYPQLRRRVAHCLVGSNWGANDASVSAMTAWLNQQYYRFDE